jgi:hypothetical protein
MGNENQITPYEGPPAAPDTYFTTDPNTLQIVDSRTRQPVPEQNNLPVSPLDTGSVYSVYSGGPAVSVSVTPDTIGAPAGATTGATSSASTPSVSPTDASYPDWLNELVNGTGDANPNDPTSEAYSPRQDPAKTVSKISPGDKTKLLTPGKDQVVDIDKMASEIGFDSNDLLAFRTYITTPDNYNYLAAWLYVLKNGSGALGATITAANNPIKNESSVVINGDILYYMWLKGNQAIKGYIFKGLESIFKKTPAYQSGFFKDFGNAGTTTVANSTRVENNPVTGPQRQTPSLVEQALNKIHPKFTEELENYLNLIRSRAYLALPALAFGALQQVVSFINRVVTAFQILINEVYQGVVRAIQEFYAFINGIMVQIQQLILSLIEKIIPLDLLCLILATIQVILDDINFISGIFGQNGSFFDFLNIVQNFVNIGSNALANPFSFLQQFIPPEVQQVIDTVNQIGSDPNGFLADMLGNYGYSYVLNYLQGNIVAGLVNQFMPQAGALPIISEIMTRFGDQLPAPLAFIPSTPAIIGPRIYQDVQGFFTDNVGNNLNKLQTDIDDKFFNLRTSIANITI